MADHLDQLRLRCSRGQGRHLIADLQGKLHRSEKIQNFFLSVHFTDIEKNKINVLGKGLQMVLCVEILKLLHKMLMLFLQIREFNILYNNLETLTHSHHMVTN